MRAGASLIAAIALSAGTVSGCSDVVATIAESVVRGTEVKEPWGRSPIVEVDPPDASLASHPLVAEAAHSVVKIRGVAPACQKILEGSGFVIAPNRVMTNAHVVAGGERVSVLADGQDHAANVVVYDPTANISVLDVPDLQVAPLAFADGVAPKGADALVMGYPMGEEFVAGPARIRDAIDLTGPDIYRTTTVTREVYVIRGAVRQGNAGGPLIDPDGRVLGVVFGAAVDDADTGFVLTAKQVSAQTANAGNSAPIPTGACVS
jgi:S1-C subfamily serine protease